MPKYVIRLNTKEFMKATLEHEITSDTELAAKIGVSVTQVWRAKLPSDDPRHNTPGTSFIAGVLKAFDGPFERFFFLDEVLRGRNEK
ncbi:hypothetical protein KM914_14355 [Virgibacillus pantothenticus]|uniref:hypothetical protein n=1 Tax=Virgibacillus pantothenticus TaxID=1473 RepID=UPI001C23DABE|nr:hypothetical protein [Virgibacillus pantothenticus]MBU8567602.1 hypothetical protein [Virgibacillus pantothenticus]MBU8601390.1 hypothetical protein [Virgibacillus pantothenticus]MBU8636207.1 hypothetical protein [Virgibacillus pantothenticus]MBU8643727.1 hypothetical protein [Virgibacillus pantothenticus]MBU8648017.1 hypothetical protein [Virgibacillus pantothenticus]